jgi:hypothetical protein
VTTPGTLSVPVRAACPPRHQNPRTNNGPQRRKCRFDRRVRCSTRRGRTGSPSLGCSTRYRRWVRMMALTREFSCCGARLLCAALRRCSRGGMGTVEQPLPGNFVRRRLVLRIATDKVCGSRSGTRRVLWRSRSAGLLSPRRWHGCPAPATKATSVQGHSVEVYGRSHTRCYLRVRGPDFYEVSAHLLSATRCGGRLQGWLPCPVRGAKALAIRRHRTGLTVNPFPSPQSQ